MNEQKRREKEEKILEAKNREEHLLNLTKQKYAEKEAQAEHKRMEFE